MKIAILGLGRMGGWLAGQLADRHSLLAGQHTLLACDPDPVKTAAFPQLACGREQAELADFAPDLLINAVPLGLTIDAFNAVLPVLPEHCVLADVASVKTGLHAWYKEAGHPFVSTHPMFGPTNANLSDLRGENAVIIGESSERGKAFFADLYRTAGITLYEQSFEEHDRTVAYSLATPFASTLVFSACMRQLDAPGTTFRKHLDIARGLLSEDSTLLAEILFNPYTGRQLELIGSQLAYLSHIIKDRDREEMDKYLDRLRTNIGLS